MKILSFKHQTVVALGFFFFVFFGLVWFSPSPFGSSACPSPELCLALCNLMDCSLPGSSVHGIISSRILEWVVIFPSRGSSPPRNRIPVPCVSCIGKQTLYHCSPGGAEISLLYKNREEVFSPSSSSCNPLIHDLWTKGWGTEAIMSLSC